MVSARRCSVSAFHCGTGGAAMGGGGAADIAAIHAKSACGGVCAAAADAAVQGAEDAGEP